MAKITAILISVFLIFNSVDCKPSGLLDVPVKGLASSLKCLTLQTALSQTGARYKSADVGGLKGLLGLNKHNVRTIAIIGDVNTVLRGDLDSQKEWNTASVGIAGIGAATLDKWSAVGEAIYVNGMSVIRPSDNGTDDYYHTRTGKTFRTQFSAFVTHEARKDGDFTVNYPIDGNKVKTPLKSFPLNGSMFISEFYSRMYSAVGKNPYCYAGIAQFDSMEAIALSMAPVYKEPLFGDNKKKYYARPVEKLPGAHAFIIGCAANYLDLEDNPELEAKMKLLLYKNPFDTGRPQAEFHGHAVTLKRCLTSMDQITADDIGEAFHMVNTARIKAANVQVYVLKSAEQMVSLHD